MDLFTNSPAEQAFRVSLERMQQGLLLLARDGSILYCSPRAGELLAREPDALLGRKLGTCLQEQEQEQEQESKLEHMLVLAADIEQHLELELGANRRPVAVSLSSTAGTGACCFCAVLTDLTTKRETEQVRRSEHRLREVAESLPQIIWTTRANGEPDYMNEYWEQYTGTSVEDAMLRDGLRQTVHPDDWPETFARWRKAVRDGESLELEHRLRRRDGSWRWHLGRVVPIRSARGSIQGWLGTTTDIESQKSAEVSLKNLAENLEQRIAERTAQLREAASEIARVEQRERRRLAQALHDHLQQLLVTARLKVSMASERADATVESKRLLADVDDLLHTTIEASRDLAVDLSPPVLHERGLPDALNWLGRRFDSLHGFRVDVDLQMPDADVGALPDPLRDFLFYSARELLFNVVKHANCASASLTLSLSPERQVELTVVDDGDGSALDQLKQREDGIGMGLSSMRQRAELWGGSLELESMPGRGFQARLKLPAPEPAPVVREVPVERRRQQLPIEDRPARREGDVGIRILLADDHAVLRDGLAGLLRQHGFIIVGEAGDGAQAIELALALQPDVVLMDISMPNINGIDATESICQQAPHIRVIGLSMHDDSQVAAAMRQAGACNFVTKNSPSEQLIASIRNCVRESATS